MAVMQCVHEALDYDDDCWYKCSACKEGTCRPKKFCPNCGDSISNIIHDLPQKKRKRPKVRIAREYYIATNFYYAFNTVDGFKISGRFYLHDFCTPYEVSVAKLIYNWLKQNRDMFYETKVFLLNEHDFGFDNEEKIILSN